MNKQKPNSSIASTAVLLGVKPETVEACYELMKFVDSLNEEELKFWKETNKYNVKSKKVV
jgi:hypothetical protein